MFYQSAATMVDECIEIIHKNQVFFHFDFSKTLSVA